MVSKDIDATDVAKVSEITRLLEEDTTPWYQKKNLRNLYFCLVPSALGVEMTSGYDGSVLNGLQAVQPWQDCESFPIFPSLNVYQCSFSGVADIVSFLKTSILRPAHYLAS